MLLIQHFAFVAQINSLIELVVFVKKPLLRNEKYFLCFGEWPTEQFAGFSSASVVMYVDIHLHLW